MPAPTFDPTPVFIETFDGTATAPGAAFNGWIQYRYQGSQTVSNGDLFRDGSGVLRSNLEFGGTSLRRPSSEAATKQRIEIDLPPWDGSATYQSYCAYAKVNEVDTAYGKQGGYFATLRNGTGFYISSSGGIISGGSGPYLPLEGVAYTIRMTTYPSDTAGNTHLVADLFVTGSPGAILETHSVDDSTSGLQGLLPVGCGTSEDNTFWTTATWGIKEARIYHEAVPTDTTGPIAGAGTSDKSGYTVDIPFTDAGSATPFTPGTGAAGAAYTVEQQIGSTWTSVPVTGATLLASGAVRLKLSGGIIRGRAVRVSGTTGRVLDSLGNASPSFSNVAITNNSVVSATQTTTYGKQIVATRGFSRSTQGGTDTNTNGAGLEAQSRKRAELPYGAESGSKFVYAGFNADGITANVIITSAGIEAHLPDGTVINQRITFGGANGVTIAHDALTYSDAITIALPPRSVIYQITRYHVDNASVGIPTHSWGYCRESATSLLDYDAMHTGAIGSLTDHALDGLVPLGTTKDGGDNVTQVGNACRIWGPAWMEGKPHRAYASSLPRHAPVFVGDSITVQQIDSESGYTDSRFDTLAARGWNGRACADNLPFVVYGQSGSLYEAFILNHTSAGAVAMMGSASNGAGRLVTHLIDEYGVNTMRTAGSGPANQSSDRTWAGRVAIAGTAAARGLPYMMTCLTPIDTSWYTWTSADYTTVTAQRGVFNNRVRSSSNTITGCIGYFDLTVPVETDPVANSNAWVTGTVFDGIHPGPQGHRLMAGQLNNFVLLDAHPNNVPDGAPGTPDPDPTPTPPPDTAPSPVDYTPRMGRAVASTVRWTAAKDAVSYVVAVNGVDKVSGLTLPEWAGVFAPGDYIDVRALGGVGGSVLVRQYPRIVANTEGAGD